MKDNSRLLFIGAGIVLVLLLLAFNGISRQAVASAEEPRLQMASRQTSPDSAVAPASVTPILDTGRATEQDSDGSLVNPDQIGRTATKQPKPSPGTNLGNVQPFDSPQVAARPLSTRVTAVRAWRKSGCNH